MRVFETNFSCMDFLFVSDFFYIVFIVIDGLTFRGTKQLNRRTTEWIANRERKTERNRMESISITVPNVILISISPYAHCTLPSDKVQFK